jgi:hypothetical protein
VTKHYAADWCPANPIYDWRDAVTFSYDVDRRTYRVSPTGSRVLSVAHINDRQDPIVPIDPAVRTVLSLQMRYSAYGFPFADLTNLNQ